MMKSVERHVEAVAYVAAQRMVNATVQIVEESKQALQALGVDLQDVDVLALFAQTMTARTEAIKAGK